MDDDVEPDWTPDGDTLDPYFDDDGWLPDWLPEYRRDTSADDWI